MTETVRVPAIRFKGFTDAWEQRKLGDVGSVAMNRRIFKEQTTLNGDVPFYKIGTFGGVADAFISEQLFEEYKAKYPYPKVGDILVSASGSIGRFVEYKGEKAYFQDSNIIWKHCLVPVITYGIILKKWLMLSSLGSQVISFQT